MNEGIMEKVLRLGASEPARTSSGSLQWKLAEIDNLSLCVIDNGPAAEFSVPGHKEEELVIVLEGVVYYDNGRVARAGEAVFHLPNTPYNGKFAGRETVRLLSIKAVPEAGATPPNPDLMKRVIRLDECPPFRRPSTGSIQKIIVATETLSVAHIENRPVLEFPEPGHPEREIIYVLQGKIEYNDGRTPRAGEAVCNLPNKPHPCSYTGTEPIRILEILSPCSRWFAEWGCL